ncbi:ATP-binding protein [Desulfatitalea tepidiphila]|uniref:ATP-binding protein n=1 Tax=Desulfatitalea tepidiphila TaxID=1185843 RepID=UPI0006B696C3|nr:ATP-binding protein [Desulfatitalea tepidiphila]
MVERLIARLRDSSLKNKIFISTTLVILLISVFIALFTRWILISSLTSELQQRGLGIASSIAESARSYILTKDIPQLTSLIIDARLGERRLLVAYVFVSDKQDNVLAHTFMSPFQPELKTANRLGDEESQRITLLHLGGSDIYDIAVPVKEGIYQIGSVHVGLYKNHIDQLISKLRTTFLGFISVVVIFCFLVSLRLARYITLPISRLTDISDALSRGSLELNMDLGRRMERLSPGNDEVYQLAQSFRNMTQRIVQSQLQLKESEQKYRSLFAGGPNPIFVIHQNTSVIMDANPAALDLYGYRRDELIGQPFTMLGPFTFKDSGTPADQKPGTSETIVVSAKERFLKKGSIPIFVHVQACPVRYAEQQALIVATTDITAMVEKDNLLIQFSKLKTLGEMSAGIAHEINQPLNAIKMGSEYLQMVIQTGRQVHEQDLEVVTAEISSQVDRAEDIITRLRDFGRKSDFSRERVALNQPVNSVLKILGRQLALQNIAIELDLADPSPVILAQSNRIEQVVFNLLTNARDAINQKTELAPAAERRIAIRTCRDAHWAIVTVTDSGVGIPESDQQRIYEAFFTTKEMGEGMGLGLSISYGIVEDYGGKIEVFSEENLGTTFKLAFPPAGQE